jgi:hypothetical protein
VALCAARPDEYGPGGGETLLAMDRAEHYRIARDASLGEVIDSD